MRLRAFIKRYGVEYTVLLPGEPKELNDKVPQGVNLNSFPTSFFLGRDGRVRSAHAGFPGKASGKFHTEAKEEITALVERLLAEPRATRRSGVDTDRHPSDHAIGAVHLTISDLRPVGPLLRVPPRLRRASAATIGRAWLGAGGRDLLVLSQCETAPRVRGTTGLYHFAILVPSRARSRAGAAAACVAHRAPCMQGAADHGVSEALYLADPDGNGIEIYRDRPRAEWPIVERPVCAWAPIRSISMRCSTNRLGRTIARELASGTVDRPRAPSRVAISTAARAFYVGVLGFELMQRYGPSALFVSAGGYHHHIGLNTWAGVGAPPPPPGAIGLRHFTVRLPDRPAIDQLAQRLRQASIPVEEAGAAILARDPSSNAILFTNS